jgi:hypothetical protein
MLAFAVLALAACQGSGAVPRATESPTGDPELWRRDRSEPYPFTTPIPPLEPTAVDGTYTRSLTRAQGAQPYIPCRRCAPYRLHPGVAVVELKAGRYHVTHEVAHFTAGGHFVVQGDRLVLFNDPNCSHVRGTYRWSLHDGILRLEPLEDPCPFDLLRARYFAAAPWDAASG